MMLWVVLLACARPHPADGLSADLAPPAPVQAVASPYEARAEPPLEGTPLAPRAVPLRAAVLDRVNPGNWNRVFQHLAADPRWRVHEWDHAIVAFERQAEGADWAVPRDGWNRDGAAWRVLLRFTAWDEGVPWGDSAQVSRVQATADQLVLTPLLAGHGPWEGHTIEATAIEGRDLSVEIGVAASGPTGDRTADALARATSVVEGVLADRDGVLERGFSAANLPEGEPRRGAQSLELRAAGPGQLELRARLNPGAPGWTWVRLVADGRPWEELAVAVGTREAIGWSADPGETFWMQGAFPAPPGRPFRATAELWQQRPGEELPVRVGAFPVRVPGR